MKKGLSSVDWIISLGIFLIYVIVIFIIFKPSIAEEYPKEYLTSILRENLQKDAYWQTFEKTPVFIDSSVSGDFQIQILYPFSVEEENTLILDASGSQIPFDVITGSPTDTLALDLSLVQGKQIIYIIHSESAYSTTQPSFLLLSSDSYSIQYGVSEHTSGFSSEKLNSLPSYETLKQQWNYPMYKEFSITIKNAITDTELFIFGLTEIPEDKRIDALYLNDILLNDNGDITPLLIIFKAW